MQVQNVINPRYKELAEKYEPLMVMYPEIEDNSRRKDSYHKNNKREGHPPLDQDYYPRDIRLILDNVWLRDKKRKATREEALALMDDNKVDFIDLIDAKGPKHMDKFWSVYAGIEKKDDNPEYHKKVYARVVEGDRWFKDYICIQYWMAIFFDDWENVHEMDWEMAAVILKKKDPGEEPVACVCNAHIGSFRKKWEEVMRADNNGERDPSGLHPVIFIANGSHAAYFSGFPPYFSVAEPYLKSELSTVLRISGRGKRFTDYVPNFEEGVKLFPEVEVIPPPDAEKTIKHKDGTTTSEKYWTGDWRWLNFKGKWGSEIEKSVWEKILGVSNITFRIYLFFQKPIREKGPPGPNTRRVCWENPFEWLNLECFDAPECKPWIIR
jgi:hypothetical protein